MHVSQYKKIIDEQKEQISELKSTLRKHKQADPGASPHLSTAHCLVRALSRISYCCSAETYLGGAVLRRPPMRR